MGKRLGPSYPKLSSIKERTSYEYDWLKRGFYVRWSDDTRSYVVQCTKCHHVTFSNDVKKIDRQVKHGCLTCTKAGLGGELFEFLPKDAKVAELNPTITAGAVSAYRDYLKRSPLIPSTTIATEILRIIRVERKRWVISSRKFKRTRITYLIQTKYGWDVFDCTRVTCRSVSLRAACHVAV